MRQSVTLPLSNNSFESIATLAGAADAAGFDTAFIYEVLRNPFTALALAARATDRIRLATGIAAAPTRTPFGMANSAADIDEISGGRAVLGLGSASGFTAACHGTTFDKPVTRMREYVTAVRAGWDYQYTKEPATVPGEFYGCEFPASPWLRENPRRQIPIYLTGIGPKMVQLGGEIADGVLGAFKTVEYMNDVVIPNVRIGAERGGRNLEDVDIASMVITCVHPDRKEAIRRARIQVGVYTCFPPCDPVIKHHGLEREKQAVLDAVAAKGFDALQDVTDDKLVDLFSIAGTPDECRAKAKEYADSLPHIIFHTPYAPPMLPEESAENVLNLCDTFGS
ncbi:LLM class flavin-dependent oxidoreductase [Sporichthya brevicatena]|uniref:LLM class flavin-dependent oxidoreductase n=1 Tax=Sporichthya brevicatena TaxID=171442 RepID=A0ABP3RQ70_9ACTN